jgi:hypothetical protein
VIASFLPFYSHKRKIIPKDKTEKNAPQSQLALKGAWGRVFEDAFFVGDF